MKYCPICKKLYNSDLEKCSECKKACKDIKDINEPVLLCVVGGLERNMICGALSDNDIPYLEETYGSGGVANEVVTGYDAKLLNISILVPYSALPKAYGIAQSVGVADETMSDMIVQVENDIEDYKKNLGADDDKMSRAKRTTVKIVTAILFFLLIAGVVWGVDYLVEFIKNLFGGN